MHMCAQNETCITYNGHSCPFPLDVTLTHISVVTKVCQVYGGCHVKVDQSESLA